MPTVSFVAAIGRVSTGALSALPKIESIVAKHGGKMAGGVGSSTDPILAEFADKSGAVKAAQEAWYLDDVESAKVLGADGNVGAQGTVAESTAGAEETLVESAEDAVEAVLEGAPVADVVTALVEKKKMPPWLKKKGDKDDDKDDKKKDDKDDKKKK